MSSSNRPASCSRLVRNDPMHILITGGAGYIGSPAAKALANAGHYPVVVDNLQRGHREAVRWGPLVEADVADRAALQRLFRQYPIEAVIHFAAFAYVGESMRGMKPSVLCRNGST